MTLRSNSRSFVCRHYFSLFFTSVSKFAIIGPELKPQTSAFKKNYQSDNAKNVRTITVLTHKNLTKHIKSLTLKNELKMTLFKKTSQKPNLTLTLTISSIYSLVYFLCLGQTARTSMLIKGFYLGLTGAY